MGNPKPVPTRAITVLEPGAHVTMEGVPAVVAAVQIWEGGHITYNVVWWNGRERHAEWVEPCEIQTREAQAMRIGFKTP